MSEEEKLAREAAKGVWAWLEKEKESRGGEFSPRLAVKFCGGCNPMIERGEVDRRVREELGPEMRWVPWEEESDLVLIINGCPTACAERAEIGKNSKALLEIRAGGVSEIEETHRAEG